MIRSIRSLALVGVALLGLAACSDDDEPTGAERRGTIRVVHASPDAPAVDVLVDNAQVLTNVAYRGASPFLAVEPGSRNIQVRATGTTTTVINADLDVATRGDYTVLATGLLAGIQPLVATDDLSDPTAGNVKVRVIHAAPAAAGVDVYVTAPGAPLATPVLTNVPFRAISAYLEVPAGTYQIRVTPTGTTTVAIDATVTFAAGHVRTIVATDAPGGGAPLGALVLPDKN